MKNRRTEVSYGTGKAMSGKVTAGFDELEDTGRALAVTIEPCQTVVRYGNDRTQVDVWYDSEMRPKRATLIEESGFIDGTVPSRPLELQPARRGGGQGHMRR